MWSAQRIHNSRPEEIAMSRRSVSHLLLATGTVCLAPLASAAPRVEVIGLGTLGGSFSEAFAINSAGQVVGQAATVGDADQHAFLFGSAAMLDLGTLGGSFSVAQGVNASGQVVGSSQTSGNTTERAFLVHGGVMRDLGTLGGSISRAEGINASGQVVGYANVSGNAATRAFLYSGGTMRDLGTLGGLYSMAFGINDSGQVVGTASTGGDVAQHAFLYNGAMRDLGTLGGSYSQASAINAGGQVVGSAATPGNAGNHAFLYSGASMQDLGTLGGTVSQAYGINASGQVVGTAYLTGNTAQHATLWNGGSTHDLDALASPGWTQLYEARAINSFAQIVGTGVRNGTFEGYVMTLHPDWQGGDGLWSDASHWNYAGLGSFGITPGAPHDVVINPAGSATVRGPAQAVVRSLLVQGNANQLVTLDLNNGSIEVQRGATLGSNATLTGNGRLQGNLVLQGGGRLRVGDAGAMQLAGTVSNGGWIDVQAHTGLARLDVGGALDNLAGGQMNLLHADVVARGGIHNSGRINIAGLGTVAGRVDNVAGGQVNVSGAGGEAIFWDDFRNNGTVTVTTGSTVSFFGLVDGGGSFGGAGTKNFAGGYAPGNSAAWVSLDGAVDFSGNALTMELGGTTPGTGHDRASFGGAVTLSGASLDVVLLDGWLASVGQAYDLFDWNGTLSGTFSSISLPGLAAGQIWNTRDLYTTGAIRVTAVPEPGTAGTLSVGVGLLGALMARRRRRRFDASGHPTSSYGDGVRISAVALAGPKSSSPPETSKRPSGSNVDAK
jgi:probable HAF family extracellular repeat protein